MPNLNFLYTFNYDYHLDALCKLESRQIFDKEEKDKLLFSPIKVDPSISAFIKTRLEIISSSENYSELLEKIKKENIHIEGFTAEYLILDGDSRDRTERRKKLKDVGFCIEGIPNFTTPSITYSICRYEDIWYFGVLTKHHNDWHKHKKKPHSFSNSIGMDVAKSLICNASQGNKTTTLLDACCGVGTVLLEACISGFDIAGCDIDFNATKYTKQNLAYYNYTANVYCSDIKDHNTKYDAAIVDLPYNLYSYSSDEIMANIIESTAKLTNRVVIVSISDIEAVIQKSGLKVTDYCSIVKKGKSTFTRKIWICEKEGELKNKSRIASISKANSLDYSVTGLSTFDLSQLNIATDQDFPLPTNVRLGHLAEKVVSELIKSSTNYKVVYENVQILEAKKTIGEIDFIIEDIKTEQIIHVELAYKFYLFDPSISAEPINNWIGPNRNDSLTEKLEKLKRKQFPLLYHSCVKSTLKDLEIEEVSQALCLLVSLFIPYEYKGSFSPTYEKAIKGYYLSFEIFRSLNNPAITYYIPLKKEWGMDPSENDAWVEFDRIEQLLTERMQEKQAPLCWQKNGESYSQFFIVWW